MGAKVSNSLEKKSEKVQIRAMKDVEYKKKMYFCALNNNTVYNL